MIAILLIVWSALASLWYWGHPYCCCNCGDSISNNISAITSYLCISFTLDTSIAIKWVRKHFVDYIQRITTKLVVGYMAKSGADKKRTDQGAEVAEQYKKLFVAFFDKNMYLSTWLYPPLGIISAVIILSLLYMGIPESLMPIMILFAFPALAYYSTALLAFVFITLILHICLHMGLVPVETKRADAASDIRAIIEASKK